MTQTKTQTSNVRLTPHWLLDLARAALGGSIDIDPCTEADNPTGAVVHYTETSPAPSPWPPGAVWCNPPWSRGQIVRWARKAMTRPYNDPVLFMTPNDPRTDWFKYLKSEADYLVILTCKVECYAPEYGRFVEPSRGVYLWAKGCTPENLRVFKQKGHLVLNLSAV